MGSFRPAAGNPCLHGSHNFAESLVETALSSLRHSCRSELHALPVARGVDYTFISPGGLRLLPLTRYRRVAAPIDLVSPPEGTAPGLSSRSRYGANGRTSTAASLGITPTPSGVIEGFTDMSRICSQDHSREGQGVLTRQGTSLGMSRHFCQARTLSSSGGVHASFDIRMPGV
jgi:hypothetical protein